VYDCHASDHIILTESRHSIRSNFQELNV